MVRRFARLRAHPPPGESGYYSVPSDGMCLNAFLVLLSPTDPGSVLLGRPASDPAWGEAGGLSPDRIARIGDRWMLPSRQLLLLEGPDDAASRIAREQLGIELEPPGTPLVFSETYSRPESEGPDPHWDLHFVYRGRGPSPIRRTSLWKELSYVPVNSTPRSGFARGHGDILELVGLPPTE